MASAEPEPVQEPPYALVTYQAPDGGEPRAGVLRDGQVCRLPALDSFHGLIELVQEWDEMAASLRGMDLEAATPVRGARPAAPLLYPRKMLFAGANYYSHAAEMGVGDLSARGTPPPPFFFMKPPTTTVVGPRDPIVIGEDPGERVDWEAELAVVIGRRARAVSGDAAAGAVAGYTILNDVSARGLHRRPVAAGEPFVWDWLASKGRDTFCPLGPGLVPAWEIRDPQALGIRLWVNGDLKQDASTSDMITPVMELVAAASHLVTLEPGDVIGTGTPAGVGAGRGEFLRPGDVIRIDVDRLGRLENPVTSDPRR